MKVRVGAVIKNSGKVLTMRYEYGGEDIYVLPGGNLEFGEELKDALLRELFEELQVETTVGRDFLTAEVRTENGKTLHQLFECTILKGEPILNPAETSALELCWLEIDNINNFNLYPDIKKYLPKTKLTNKYVGVIEQKWF